MSAIAPAAADDAVVARRPGSRAYRLLLSLDRAIGLLVEVPAAFLVVAEIVVLFIGVVSRYVFHSPIVWSDELASILFLWLAMLGSVVAFRRAEHMRMTAVVSMTRPATRPFFEAIAVTVSVGFLVLTIEPALEFALEERFITTPALEISNAWRAAALPIGIGLMLVIGILRLFEMPQRRSMLAALAVVAALGVAFYLAGPLFRPLGNYNLLLFFVGVVGALVFAGVPIAFTFGIATFGYLALTTRLPVIVLIGRMDEGMSHLILLAVPLFVFLGLLIEMTGMARAMVGFLASLLGHVRGGLSYVLVGAMYLVSGISGSKAADMAAVAPVLFPEMKARGAKEGDLVALLSATGAQTETIPPSIVLITIGSVTGVSISALFTGGLLPGVVLGITLCSLVWWRYRDEDLSGVARPSGRAIGRAFVIAVPALLLPFVIRAAVVEGVATATEVSTIGIVYAALAGILIYRQFPLGRLYPMLVTTAALSGAHPPHHRGGDRHGLGADPIWLLDHARDDDEVPPGRHAGVPDRLCGCVRDPGIGARGHSRDRAVRPPDVPDRQAGRRARGALRDGGSSSRWASASSRLLSGSATTPPAPSAASILMPECDRSSATSPPSSWGSRW